jgi:glycosyltransferase involved in cell wall biosynthesis
MSEWPNDLRLLAILPYFHPHIGGGETHLRMLGGLLATRGVRVEGLTQGLPGSPALEILDGIHVRRFGSSLTKSGQATAYKEFVAQLAESPAHAVHYIYFSVGSVFRMENIRDVMEACIQHAKSFIVRIPSSGRVTEACAHDLRFKRLLREADAVIALNSEIQDELLSIGVSDGRISFIPNAVDGAIFSPDPAARHNLRQKLALTPDTKLVLSVSRFAPKKRIGELVDTWAQIRQNHPRAVLLLIGDEKFRHMRHEYDALISERRQHDHSIIWLGAIPNRELPSYYAGSDIFVSFSTQEGMSNSMLEAAATGLVAVAPDTAATLSVCSRDTNFLYAKDSPTDRLQQLDRALSCSHRKRLDMGNLNTEAARANFSPDAMADRFHNLLRRLANRPAAACGEGR